ncbi:NAD(P)-dependent oxidoreductase [Rhodoluna limnophila]|uniref:NAD(P)-dependent oxidoreductase n=1 Tax=Rhodoluna limnophila TaxID=232537 RepID=UPI001107535F|nr:NAD(P)-dependent oxidoreductase [Rhodoluna limnophila]
MQIVVGLGPVESDVVQPVLGDAMKFVEHPTDADIAEASGAIVRAAFVFDEAQFAKMPNLRVLARTGVGTDLVDLNVAEERGIDVVITPGSNTNAVAEGALAHALHLTKRLGPLTKLVANGNWDQRTKYPVGDFESKTFGIVGFGRIGRRVAELAKAFGMKVLAYDPFALIPEDQRASSIEELVAASDVISLHVPLTEATNQLVNADLLAQFKPGAVLINCGRGALIDLDAAHDALRSGKLGGLGLDVFDPEPPAHHQIFEHENVVLTPHVMGLSVQSTKQTFIDAAQGVRDSLEGRKPQALAKK